MEININAYLDNYAKNNKGYKKNDLASNQAHFAKLLQYIYVTGCLDNPEKVKLYFKYQELLTYCEALILKRRIPKYVRDELGEEFLSKFNMILVNRLKFKPETSGEIIYVDNVLNLPEYKQEKLRAVAIAQFWNDYEKKDAEIVELKKEIEKLKKEIEKLKSLKDGGKQ